MWAKKETINPGIRKRGRMKENTKKILSLIEENKDLRGTLLHKIIEVMTKENFSEETKTPGPGEKFLGEMNSFEKAVSTINSSAITKMNRIIKVLRMDLFGITKIKTENALNLKKRLSFLETHDNAMSNLLWANIHRRFKDAKPEKSNGYALRKGNNVYALGEKPEELHMEFSGMMGDPPLEEEDLVGILNNLFNHEEGGSLPSQTEFLNLYESAESEKPLKVEDI